MTELCYRPGVFYTIKMDGCLDVWDYFYKQNDPTLQVCLLFCFALCAQIATDRNLCNCGCCISPGFLAEATAAKQQPGGIVQQPNVEQLQRLTTQHLFIING